MTCMHADIPQSFFLWFDMWKTAIREISYCTDMFATVSTTLQLSGN